MYKQIKFIIFISFFGFLPLLFVAAATPLPPPRPSAQETSTVQIAPHASPATSLVDSTTTEVGVTLDEVDADSTRIANSLKNKDLTDAALTTLEAQLEVLPPRLDAVVGRVETYLASLKARSDQLGPKPPTPEAPEVVMERNDLQKHQDAADGFLKRAKLFSVEVAQTKDEIEGRRRELFARASWWRGFVWDVPSDLRAAFFGFTVGGVLVSPFHTLVAVFLFAAIFGGWRMVLGWTDRRVLSHFDSGTRGSMRTVLGYVGTVVAFCLAVNYLGVDLGKLAIIAGALSVGVGFGLQTIVNNFVSGLIILWERTIRVGDLVVIGAERGVVKRISIRSTTLDTFDHSQVIIPNSMLVSGVVTNFVGSDRVGRVVISLTVSALVDLSKICEEIELLVKSHVLVLRDPAPTVEVVAILPTFDLTVEVSAFVADIETVPEVKSGLFFSIVKYLKSVKLPAVSSVPVTNEVQIKTWDGVVVKKKKREHLKDHFKSVNSED